MQTRDGARGVMAGFQSGSQRRWALSLADIALLIACLLLLSFRSTGGPSADRAAARASIRLPISGLFEPGEAVLRPGAGLQLRARLSEAQQPAIRVAVSDSGSTRLDAWELAAARTAAIARVVHQDAQLRAPGGVAGTVEISRQ
jgi:hypothetical protein